jgi:hypothetical protein
MPNHFLTIGLCARDYDRLEAQGLEDYDDVDLEPIKGANLCKILMPLPSDLNGIVDGNAPCRFRHKVTGEFHQGLNGPIWDRGENDEHWECVVLTKDEISALVAKHGACTWYEWQNENWGTKWGTYDTTYQVLGGDGSPILIEFQTAWGPPSPAMMRKIDDYLCETYYLKDIRWIGHDPSGGSTCDIEVLEKEGETV